MTNKYNTKVLGAFVVIVSGICFFAYSQDPKESGMATTDRNDMTTRTSWTTSETSGSGSMDADNTGRNARDRDMKSSTPLDQGNSESDVEITRNIRKEVNASDNLSVKAKNVKIITANGRVVIRGPVESDSEKQRIGDIARKIAGSDNVTDQIEVKAAD